MGEIWKLLFPNWSHDCSNWPHDCSLWLQDTPTVQDGYKIKWSMLDQDDGPIYDQDGPNIA